MDFSNYVRSLLHAGRAAEARTLWESVVGVIHNGTKPNVEVLGIPELPGVCRVPCMESPCMRCDTRGGGFQFPFVGIWTRTAVLARAGDTAQSVWERYHAGEDTFELLALQRVASGVTRAQLLPRHVNGALARLALCCDGITMQELFELWRAWQHGSWTACGGVVWINDEYRRAGAALRCILGAVEAEVDWIPGPCRLCWIPTFTSCPTCGGAVCEECRRGGDFCPFCGSSDDEF